MCGIVGIASTYPERDQYWLFSSSETLEHEALTILRNGGRQTRELASHIGGWLFLIFPLRVNSLCTVQITH